MARVLALSILVMGTLVLSTALLAKNASADSVSGAWVSSVSGEGYVQQDVIYRWHYDVELKLTQSGSYVYGTIKMTIMKVDLKVSSYQPYPYTPNQAFSYQVDGDVTGSALAMTIHGDGQDMTFNMQVSDGSMTGSGSYNSAGATINGVFDLKKSSGLLGFGSLSEMAPLVSASVIVISIVVLAIVSTPVKIPTVPGTEAVPSQLVYQPGIQGQTGSSPPGMPDGGTPVGGVGLHYPSPPPEGTPLPPRDHYSRTSQDSPRCPIHGDVALVPHYFATDGSDAGSWFCPRCNSYPWGRS